MTPRVPPDNVVAYEPLDLSEVDLPPRSRLYHLTPVAFGTSMVESLTSYFARLAEAHFVSAGALTYCEVLPLHAGRRDMFACPVAARARCQTSALNNLGSTAARFADVVGKLTGRTDLDHLTMLPWRLLLPTQLVTRGVAGWCPRCLNSWRDSGKTVYIPLLWTLEAVKYCPAHQCLLQTVCPYCERPQPLLGQRCPVAHCHRCKKWLGADGMVKHSGEYFLLPVQTPEWEVWASNQIKDMIRAGFEKPSLLTRQQLSRLLWRATKIERLRHFARMAGVSATSISNWRLGRSQPTLPGYLRIAWAIDRTLTDLLAGTVQPESVHSLHKLALPTLYNVRRIRQPQQFEACKAKQQLIEALHESSSPPSLTKFQKRTGYHYATLRKHFPKLCNALCRRFRRYQLATIRKRREEKIAEFRKTAHRFHDEGFELFIRPILDRMSLPWGLPYRLACRILVDVKHEILARERIRG